MKHRILVLGAGYAGASAAGRIARRLRRADADITLVNAEPDFVERVRMHQLATGQDLKPRPLAEMFEGTGVRLRLGKVTSVDVEAKTAALDDGETLPYDTLVYALGSVADDHDVPGVDEHAYPVASRSAAQRLRKRLQEVEASAKVVVVGGGLTGIEAVTEIAEARPDLDVALTTRGELGTWLSPGAQRHLRKATDRLGITVHEGVSIDRVESDGVVTGAGESVPAAVTVWAGGFAVHPIAAATALEVGDTGQIVVDRTMRSVSHPDVYAVGDAALAEGTHGSTLRMSCASGIPTAWQAADAIASRLTGRRKIPKTPLVYVHQCISLGRGDGIIQMVSTDDRARGASFKGRGAARYKELICKSAAWMVAKPITYPVRRRHVVGPAAVAASQAPAEAV